MDELLAIMEEIGILSAYDHFAEGEAVDPPFITYLLPGSDNFSADGKVYYKINDVHIELYTDAKDPEVESCVEAVLDEHGIFYDKVSKPCWMSTVFFMTRQRCGSTPRSCMRSCIHSKWRVKTWETK